MKKSVKKLLLFLIVFAIIYGVFWTLSYDSLISLNFEAFNDMTFLFERVMPILSIAMGIIGSLLSIHLLWLFLITFIYNLGTYAFVTLVINLTVSFKTSQVIENIVGFIPAVLVYLVCMMVAFTIVDGIKHVYRKKKAKKNEFVGDGSVMIENDGKTISTETTDAITEEVANEITTTDGEIIDDTDDITEKGLGEMDKK